MLYIEIIKVMDLDVLPNAQCTQFHGKWAEKDRNFGVTLMIEPVFMRATREGVKIMVVSIAIVALCSGVSWISVGRKLRGTAAPKASRTDRTVSYIAIGAASYIVARLIFSGMSDDAAWLVGTLAVLVAAIVLSFYTYPLYLAFLIKRGDS